METFSEKTSAETEYKCISCGETKTSENRCTCSYCGYPMYPTPFDKKEKLISEISGYIRELKCVKISESDIDFVRTEKKSGNSRQVIIPKKKDDDRFPSFETIQKYACSADKTEVFMERLEHTYEEIDSYLHTDCSREYFGDYTEVVQLILERDELLESVLDILGISAKFPKQDFPKLILKYRESPDADFIESADILLDLLSKVTVKLKKFIKMNNIYGGGYKKPLKVKLAKDWKNDISAEIQRVTKRLYEVNEKKYVVDIFSDGKEELEEILKEVWLGIYALLKLPILKKTYLYIFENETEFHGAEFTKYLSEINSQRYADVDISAALSGTEEELFEVYTKLIETDSIGYFKANSEGLIRIGEGEKKLNTLIGLEEIKSSIQKIKSYVLANKGGEIPNLHMCFYGNPGTGKTEVARIISRILYDAGVLADSKLIETDSTGLISTIVGETGKKTHEKVMDVMGGVLFIDEAYLLMGGEGKSDSAYGEEAIAVLLKDMENYRGRFCTVMAGYKKEMQNLLSANPGFQSRIQFTLEFPDYTREEMMEIALKLLNAKKYSITDDAMNKILDLTDYFRNKPDFANARTVRNILDQVILDQNLRAEDDAEDFTVILSDVEDYIMDENIDMTKSSGRKIGFI